MPTLLIAAVLIAGLGVLAVALYSNSATRSQYRLGQASDIDMRRSTATTAVIVVAVVAAIASAPLVWSLATKLPSLSTEEETSTTSTDTTTE